MSLFISSTVYFCLLKKKSVMQEFVYLITFLEQPAFHSVDQVTDHSFLTVPQEWFFGNSNPLSKTHQWLTTPHPRPGLPTTSAVHLSTLSPSALPSSNIRFLLGPKMSAHFMLCAFVQTLLFSSIIHLVKIFKFQLKFSSLWSFSWPIRPLFR